MVLIKLHLNRKGRRTPYGSLQVFVWRQNSVDELQFPEITAVELLGSHWSLSLSGGGRHEEVVRSRRRSAAELETSSHARRVWSCSWVPLRKKLRSAPLKLKSPPAEWRAPSMRRLALILLPCAVAFLVHLWLAQRPVATPPDINTLSGTF